MDDLDLVYRLVSELVKVRPKSLDNPHIIFGEVPFMGRSP